MAKANRAASNNESIEARYLRILKAASIEELEERIVSKLVQGLSNQIEQRVLPLKLSKIANQFLIEPRPLKISGSHDGELEYNQGKNRFFIKLCSPTSATDQPLLNRQRFTYAHEMAHRFFFVEQENVWVRAIDLATATTLSPAERIRERRHLNHIEESLCNRIAHSVLIPDSILLERCNLDHWFGRKDALYRTLSKASNEFGVSRECMVARIGTAIRRKVIEPKDGKCLMVIAKSRGTITQRGREALRVKVCFFPRKLNDQALAVPFPGFELHRFGPTAEQFFEQGFGSGDSSGEMDLSLSLSRHSNRETQVPTRLVGWWRSYGTTPSYRRLCVWGTLSLSNC
ncbi:MAG TPA: ImmA/IrrE family metallo-endopeptidase [Pyrinomonadaceae bacterium]